MTARSMDEAEKIDFGEEQDFANRLLLFLRQPAGVRAQRLDTLKRITGCAEATILGWTQHQDLPGHNVRVFVLWAGGVP